MTVKVKATFAQSSITKKHFNGTVCALPISIGQPHHEAEKMLATTNLINKHFAKCIVIVCDSLQRHTSMLYGSAAESIAYKEAIKAGSQWIERNTVALKQLKIPTILMRWDYWYHRKDFSGYLAKIEKLYITNTSFKKAVDHCSLSFIEQFILRYNGKIFNQSAKQVMNLCKNYLKEEAAILLMWENEGFNFLAYPGSNNKVMSMVQEHFITKDYKVPILKYLKIKFKKK